MQDGAPPVISWFTIPLTSSIYLPYTIVMGVINLANYGAPPRVSHFFVTILLTSFWRPVMRIWGKTPLADKKGLGCTDNDGES